MRISPPKRPKSSRCPVLRGIGCALAIVLGGNAWAQNPFPAIDDPTPGSFTRPATLQGTPETVLLESSADGYPNRFDPGGEAFYPIESDSIEGASIEYGEVPILTADPFLVGDAPVPSSSRDRSPVRVGYDKGFVMASGEELDLGAGDFPFLLKLNGYGQLRDTRFQSDTDASDLNQLQLKRARIVLGGHAYTEDLTYFVQIDGRSNSGDDIRLLDYYFQFDLAHRLWNCEPGTFGVKAGRYKMPFSMARALSGKQFQFADRSMSSAFFDVNRSLGTGLYGVTNSLPMKLYWEVAIFNGLVTGGAETGSAGTLDNNNAFSGHIFAFPIGQWGRGQLADFDRNRRPAMRVGAGFATTQIDREGLTEFNSLRVVDSGSTLASVLPGQTDGYDVQLFAINTSLKYRGASMSMEYYFRNINGFRGIRQDDLSDNGFWLQAGLFLIENKLEILARWSRVVGNSDTLGGPDRSSDEVAGGLAYYFRDQHVKLVFDATHLNGATISSPTLDIFPGDDGWLLRTQMQFSF